MLGIVAPGQHRGVSDFRAALVQYGEFLSTLGVEPPFKWIVGMENLKGRGIYFPPPPGQAFLFSGPKGQCQMDVATGDGLYPAAF
jgi:hypothetical protein